jgi:hypothetical protein
MLRSTVQFQKGLSLPSFLATYGTEEQWREALYRIRWPSGFCCPRCGHRSYFFIKTRMLYQCTDCRTQTSLMIAEFCYRFNNRFNVGEMIPKLIRAAARTPPIPSYILELTEDWW